MFFPFLLALFFAVASSKKAVAAKSAPPSPSSSSSVSTTVSAASGINPSASLPPLVGSASHPDLLELVTPPATSDAIHIGIPAFHFQFNSSRGIAIAVNNDLVHTVADGLFKYDAESPFGLEVTQALKTARHTGAISKDPRAAFFTLIERELLFPRHLLNATKVIPKNPMGVDVNITSSPRAIAQFLGNNMKLANVMDPELKLWFYHTSVVYKGREIVDLRNQSLTLLPIDIESLPQGAETLCWYDIARVTAFCGTRGLSLFWSLIRDVRLHPAPVDTPETRASDPRWVELRHCCAVQSDENFNRILFRRPKATLDDKLPGICAMFSVSGSSIYHGATPSIEEIEASDL